MKMRSLALPAIVLAGSMTFAACGGSDHSSTGTNAPAGSGSTAGSSASIPADADFNAADVSFAQGMIPHHEQAVEMADMALDPTVGASDEVKKLATDIQGAQDPEIKLMKGWLATWGQPEMGDMAGHDMSSMEGMMSADDMDKLGTLTGADFDTLWLQMMIKHHEGAVKMAENVKANGKSSEVATLADQVIAAQTAEIDAMNVLLTS